MFLTSSTWYDRFGQQRANGLFLILCMRDRPDGAEPADDPLAYVSLIAPGNVRAFVRHVRMEQLGHFMMGEAYLHGHRVGLSGPFGGDGLPTNVPHALWKRGVALPTELAERWGASTMGVCDADIREWANANLNALKRASRTGTSVGVVEGAMTYGTLGRSETTVNNDHEDDGN